MRAKWQAGFIVNRLQKRLLEEHYLLRNTLQSRLPPLRVNEPRARRAAGCYTY